MSDYQKPSLRLLALRYEQAFLASGEYSGEDFDLVDENVEL